MAILRTLDAVCGPDVVRGAWLDVGCGSGGVAATLAGAVERIDGVDVQPWEGWGRHMAEIPNLRLFEGSCDGTSLPVSRGSYDVVICNQVYEHVTNPRQLLVNINDMLAPNGVCYFAGPNLLWPIEPHVHWPFVHWVPRRFAQSSMRFLGSHRFSELDAWSLDYWRLTALFERAGLKFKIVMRDRLAVEIGSGLFPRMVRAASGMPNWTFSLAAPLLPGFAFLLRKP